ncbi:hypothetical protein [Bosea eneae]
MDQVTEQQVVDAIVARQYRPWTLRRCSICEGPIGYAFLATDAGQPPRVGFDSYCGCSRFDPGVDERSIGELMNTFNRQSPEHRAEMWADFTTLASGKERP